jgi:hypothetical protein
MGRGVRVGRKADRSRKGNQPSTNSQVSVRNSSNKVRYDCYAQTQQTRDSCALGPSDAQAVQDNKFS